MLVAPSHHLNQWCLPVRLLLFSCSKRLYYCLYYMFTAMLLKHTLYISDPVRTNIYRRLLRAWWSMAQWKFDSSSWRNCRNSTYTGKCEFVFVYWCIITQLVYLFSIPAKFLSSHTQGLTLNIVVNIDGLAQCKTAVSPLLTHWRYCSFTLSHRLDLKIYLGKCGQSIYLWAEPYKCNVYWENKHVPGLRNQLPNQALNCTSLTHWPLGFWMEF